MNYSTTTTSANLHFIDNNDNKEFSMKTIILILFCINSWGFTDDFVENNSDLQEVTCQQAQTCVPVSRHGRIIGYSVYECGLHRKCFGGGNDRPPTCIIKCDCQFLREACSP